MSKHFNDYKAGAAGIFQMGLDAPAEWQRLHDWWSTGGRELFIDAFAKETGLKVKPGVCGDAIVASALPKSLADLEKKAKSDAFYRAHAIWFLEEMDTMIASVPSTSPQPDTSVGFGNVCRFARHVLLDSILLFEHWGTMRADVPGVFGIGKNVIEHIMAFYQGARQTIYGHGSWGLSFSDNHADLATATIRQVVEIRLRRGFGIMGKLSVNDQSFHPIPLSALLDAIDHQRQQITFPIRFENITRINSWANLYLHGALKLYAWTPPRVLKFLHPFLLGYAPPGSAFNSKAGIMLSRKAFDAVRTEVEQTEKLGSKAGSIPAFDVLLTDPVYCDALIQ